jgi:precorrin-6Y C5,15-methyltransferase (decarboxylating)
VLNLDIVQAVMPAKLAELPSPDRVFIGGGGKNLETIINTAAACLRPGGVITINTVMIASMATALSTLKSLDFETEIVQVQVNTGRQISTGDHMEAANPVWITTGRKKKEP